MDDIKPKSQTNPPAAPSPSAIPLTATTNTITTRDGRTLAYLDVGDPRGRLLIHNHGGPSSRLEARLFASAAVKHRLRFLCVDRPGMGQSSPQQSRTYAGWADDLVAIADALGYHEFGVSGWSEGGPWALAAAAFIDPLRLRHVSSIAGGSYGAFGDNWAAANLSKADALGGFLALHFEPGFRLMYAALGITAAHFRGAFFNQLQKKPSTITTNTSCSSPALKPPSAKVAPSASLKAATAWFKTPNSYTNVGPST